MFNEYPKMLYQGDEAKVVDCLNSEREARHEGWHEFGEEEKPRRGRPPGSTNKTKEE